MSSVTPPRCSRHNLATGPDGQCVLCRREQIPAVARVAPLETSYDGPRMPAWALTMVVVAVAGGALAWSARGMGRGSTQLSAAGPNLAELETAALRARDPHATRDTPQPQPEAEPEHQETPEEQIARAERERIERERAEREQQDAQRGAQQQTSSEAEAQRKLDEAARDRERHERIARDLDKTSLASARRAVNITMYSTSWCGACAKARSYMRAQNIPFTDLDVERDEAARTQAHALNPRGSVPTIAIDNELLIGFSPTSLEARIDQAARRRKGS